MKKFKLNLSTVIGALLIALAIVIAMTSNVVFAKSYNFDVKEQTEEFYVNDFAGIFSKEQKEQMQAKAVSLDSTHDGIQVVVTTVNSLEGHEIEEYAKAMYDQYGIGKDSMGLLILLSVGDRDVRIETGYKMQSYITDSVSGRLLDDYGMEHFKKNEFAEGLVKVQNASIDKIIEKVPADWATHEPRSIDIDFGPFFTVLGIIVVISASGFLIVILVRKVKQKRQEKEDAFIAQIREERDKEWRRRMDGIEDSYNSKISTLERQVSSSDSSVRSLTSDNQTLTTEKKQLMEKMRIVKALHPNIDREISDYIEDGYKQQAKAWDDANQKKVIVTPTEDNSLNYSQVIDSYESLDSNVRKYVKTDISTAKSNLKKANHLKDIAIATGVAAVVAGLFKKVSQGDHTTYGQIEPVYSKYANLTDAQKAVYPDKPQAAQLAKMYSSAKSDYANYTAAKSVESTMQNAVSSAGYSADRDDLNSLKSAKRKYDSLNTAQAAFISAALYQSLKKKIREAEEDEEEYQRRKRREEEERRRRQQAMRNNSMHNNHSSFTGRGGHSGGGGATRHF